MNKKQFKSQASSSRVNPAGSLGGFGGFGSSSASSTLSYLTSPPNLSFITDANVVVCFKNLTKRDGTTKSKALEDLRAYVQAHAYEVDGGVEDAVLDAWVQFYPRISIDTSRRVRELAHSLQYELLKSARKRMEKHIPKIVGSWLAGTYDRDRVVSRSATDGITSFLDNENKVLLFWKRCQVQILDYALEAINETPQSLSDERTVIAEDVQSKYLQVLGSSISLVLNLLSKLTAADIEKHQDKYAEFLSNNKKLWSLVSAEDPFVRRTTARLLEVCLDTQTSIIEVDLELISHAFISEALRAPQASSAFQLLQALAKLSSRYPQVWTTAYKGKKSSLSRLRHFVAKGSQGGPPTYWSAVRSLLAILPREILPKDLETALEFTRAIQDGIGSRGEPRNYASEAWNCYIDITTIIAKGLDNATTYQKFYEEAVYPIFSQYLHPTVDNSRWTTGNGNIAIAKAYSICSSSSIESLSSSLSTEWHRLADEFIQRIDTSLPELSKDYHKSQTAIVAESHRWFALLSSLIQGKSTDHATHELLAPSISIVKTAVDALVNRNGKPYSAAATIETALRLTPSLVQHSSELSNLIKSFLDTHLLKMMTSPSSKYLVAVLYLYGSLPDQTQTFEQIWKSTISSLLTLPDSKDKMGSIIALISNHAVSELSQADQGLQEFFSATAVKAVHDPEDAQAWLLFESAVEFDLLAERVEKQLLSQIVGGLDDQVNEARITSALKALEFISQRKPATLKNDSKLYVTLVTKLLSLTELNDTDITSRASKLRSTIENFDKGKEKAEDHQSPMLRVIRENLETATAQSLTVETLVQQAKSILATAADHSVLDTLLPDVQIWKRSLSETLNEPPNQALAVMRPFAGAVYLQRNPATRRMKCARDLSGYTIALRMAMYTTRLIVETSDLGLPNLGTEELHLLGITSQLLQDQVDLQSEDQLATSLLDSDVMSEVQEFLFDAKTPVSNLIANSSGWLEKSDTKADAVKSLISTLIRDTSTSNPVTFYATRVLSDILQRLVNEQGWHNINGESWLQSLDILKPSTANILGATALLIGLQDILGSSKLVNRLCNGLISDIAGATATSEKTLNLLVLLNATMPIYEDGDLPVAQNRLVFAVKQILSWTDDLATSDPKLASEACHALHRLLPAIKTVYGSYWETSLGFCVSIWDADDQVMTDERIPMIGMSLKLYTILRSLTDANDDLEDALSQLQYQINHGLVKLLTLRRLKSNVPLLFIDNIISREVSQIAPKVMENDFSDFYPLVASDFRAVQSSAYEFLHRALPEQQQQISVDVLLESRDAQLPEELLSLLLDAPSLNSIPDEVLADFPSSTRGYLLSWLLVFDSYSTASFKVRADYSVILRTEGHINPLLDFIFDVLGHSAGHPLSLTNFEVPKIRAYDLAAAEDQLTPEHNLHWLLVHLYYLSLKYVPNLAKNWFLDCKSKQTRIAVESWTEKYFSPLIIEDTMTEVTRWADEQETSEEEKELIVKVSRKSREVLAGYEVDDTMMQIVIRLPPAYPLEGVKVEGVQRVAVTKQKWTAWLMNTQGAITFSNGSIPDSLTLFRRNIIAALKGKDECAICYSLISSDDKKMPDKRCGTCKNLFHGSCLFKWFASSNQSTCPLCRNPFNYGVSERRKPQWNGEG